MKRIIQSCIIVYCILPLLLTPPLTFAKNNSHNQLRIISDGYDYYFCSSSINQYRLFNHLKNKGLSDNSIFSLLRLAKTDPYKLAGYNKPSDNNLRAIMYEDDKKLYRACSYPLQEQKVLEIGIKRELTEPDIHKAMREAKNNPMTIYIIRSIKDQSPKSQHK